MRKGEAIFFLFFAFGANTKKRKTPQNVGFFLAGIGRIKKVPAIIGETKL